VSPRDPIPRREAAAAPAESPFVRAFVRNRELEAFLCFDPGPAEPRGER